MKKIKFLWILGLAAVVIYGIYSFLLSKKIHQASEQSVKIARERFFKATFNDTIDRIDQVYANKCRFGFWIKNFSMDYVVIDVCKYPVLKQVTVDSRVLKDSNSNKCTFIRSDGKELSLDLNIEY